MKLRNTRTPARPDGVLCRRGFSILEVLLAVGALAIIAGLGIMSVSQTTNSSKRAKLESDISTLNAAVQMYLVNGGDLSGAATPNDVLAKMKTVVTAAQAERQINVLTGSMIDRRLVAEMQTTTEAATGEPRVYWNASDQVFQLATSGGVGVKRFVLDPTMASVAVQTESRNSGVMEFAASSGWVWDHTNNWTTDSSLVPTGVSTNPFPDPPDPPATTAGTANAGTATAGTATSTAGTATAGEDTVSTDTGGDGTAGSSTAGTATSGDDGTPPDPPRLPTPVLDTPGVPT